jgi:hypothetical protein
VAILAFVQRYEQRLAIFQRRGVGQLGANQVERVAAAGLDLLLALGQGGQAQGCEAVGPAVEFKGGVDLLPPRLLRSFFSSSSSFITRRRHLRLPGVGIRPDGLLEQHGRVKRRRHLERGVQQTTP